MCKRDSVRGLYEIIIDRLTNKLSIFSQFAKNLKLILKYNLVVFYFLPFIIHCYSSMSLDLRINLMKTCSVLACVSVL